MLLAELSNFMVRPRIGTWSGGCCCDTADLYPYRWQHRRIKSIVQNEAERMPKTYLIPCFGRRSV